MQIPLHNNLPQYAIAALPEQFKKALADRARHAYTMFSLAAAATSKRSIRLPKGVVAGFNTQYVTDRLKDAGMISKEPPPLSPRALRRRENAEAHREAVRNDPTRGLTNWELHKYIRALHYTYKTGQAKPNPADFRGLSRA